MGKLSADEEAFLRWWEANRQRQKKLVSQLMVGLPLGVAFGLPVLLSVLFRNWYKRMPYISGTQLTVIFIAVLLIIVFFVMFRMYFKWDMHEQRYKELRAREKEDK
jgi:glucan phosphoethanolaminetransferase (alkaline phosphatase superfamily)